MLRNEREAKAEEAGDEDGLPLEKIFIDLTLGSDLLNATEDLKSIVHNETERATYPYGIHTRGLLAIPASLALLIVPQQSMLLKGGPGVGKSTVTQFVTLYHAARIVQKDLADRLTRRLELDSQTTPAALDALCEVRIPFRVELRRYAQWMSDVAQSGKEPFLGGYLADKVGKASSCELQMDDIFFIARGNPVLLIMDGLDEVPNPETRATIFKQLEIFIDRSMGENSNVQLLLSTRPQGYRGEFKGFKPVEWVAQDLEKDLFDRYCVDWLELRIPSTDDRADAQKRISNGMESPAVQQLAKTLLQATVMLTIARRKLPIPHAREKLFERYVDVMFDREKNKETIKDMQTELKLLHERVGYELLRKMERKTSDNKTLGYTEFCQYVYDVIADYGSKELGARRIREIVEEIARIAKDRLCLLAGKGEDQSNIDFVIQSFREYFAAKYLANHEDADAEKVFESLCRRSHFWGSVLQFYAAVQSKAQQKAWISEIDGTGMDIDAVDELVWLTRKRRALLRVLPEFDKPKNVDIERALTHLFEATTRWTWASATDTASLLTALSPEHVIRILEALFNKLSFDDLGNLGVELDLLTKLPKEDSMSPVLQKLQSLLSEGGARSLVLELACANDLSLNLESVPVEDIWASIYFRSKSDHETGPNFIRSLTDAQCVECFMGGVRSSF